MFAAMQSWPARKRASMMFAFGVILAIVVWVLYYVAKPNGYPTDADYARAIRFETVGMLAGFAVTAFAGALVASGIAVAVGSSRGHPDLRRLETRAVFFTGAALLTLAALWGGLAWTELDPCGDYEGRREMCGAWEQQRQVWAGAAPAFAAGAIGCLVAGLRTRAVSGKTADARRQA